MEDLPAYGSSEITNKIVCSFSCSPSFTFSSACICSGARSSLTPFPCVPNGLRLIFCRGAGHLHRCDRWSLVLAYLPEAELRKRFIEFFSVCSNFLAKAPGHGDEMLSERLTLIPIFGKVQPDSRCLRRKRSARISATSYTRCEDRTCWQAKAWRRFEVCSPLRTGWTSLPTIWRSATIKP